MLLTLRTKVRIQPSSIFIEFYFPINRPLEGRSVDQVVIVLTFYSKDPSLNPAKVLLCLLFEKERNKQKEAVDGQIKTIP